jgi:RNA polymerase sigma factor (sigma-70 family)
LRLLSDDRLVGLIRDGNANAFEAVYDRHYRAILSFCRHMLGGTDEAEDAVQHTFIAAYNDLVSSGKPIRLRPWLFTIARNRCLSILRTRRERTAVEFEEPTTDGLAVQVQRRQDLRDLVVDINHLPDDQRAALVLAEMGALAHDEIGSVIGVPKDKVKALIFQARESLLADRAAREADCQDIREQLATMRGAALRRTTLRRHLRGCQGCREYRHELESQRRRLAIILPVVPTFALRNAILGVTAGGVTAGAGVAGGGLLGAGSLLKGAVGKALIAALLAAAGTTGTILVVHDVQLAAGTSLDHHRASTSVLGASAAHLATRSGSSSSSTGAALLGTAGDRAGAAGLGTGAWAGHGNARGRALVHSMTAPVSNLLSPVWPHERQAGGSGSAAPVTTPASTPAPTTTTLAPVSSIAAPASSSPATSSPAPTTGSPAGTSGTGTGAGSGRSASGSSGSSSSSGGSGASRGASPAGGSSGASTATSSSSPSAASTGSSSVTSVGSGPAGGAGSVSSGSGSSTSSTATTGSGSSSTATTPVSSSGSGPTGGAGSGPTGGAGGG